MIMKEDIKNVGVDTQSLVYRNGNISGAMFIEYNDDENLDILDFSADFAEDNTSVKSVEFEIDDLYHPDQISIVAIKTIRDTLKENLETNFGQLLRYLFD